MSLRDNLIAEYLCNGTADDTSGHGRHGVIHGAAPVADRFGNPNCAFQFDGTDDHIVIAPPPAFSANALSVSVWARFDTRDLKWWTNSIIAQDNGNDEDQSRRVFQISAFGGHMVWHRMIGARDPMCKRRIQFGEWYHIVAVHDAGMNRLYVDGELCDEVKHAMWVHADEPLYIGRKGSGEPFFFFSGAIDDVRMYDRVLNDFEIHDLLREGGWTPRAPGAAQGDPVSGRWGEHGVVFLDLRYDGARLVTGRIMSGRPNNMAPIVTGTFDRRTGTLRLAGVAKDPHKGEIHNYTIEGIIDNGDATVVAHFGGFEGNFILTKSGAQLRPSWRSVRSQLGALTYAVLR